MLGAQRPKAAISLQVPVQKKFGASVIMDNKYACNTYIETDRIIYVSQKQGDPVGVQSILQSSASEVPTIGLLSCMG